MFGLSRNVMRALIYMLACVNHPPFSRRQDSPTVTVCKSIYLRAESQIGAENEPEGELALNDNSSSHEEAELFTVKLEAGDRQLPNPLTTPPPAKAPSVRTKFEEVPMMLPAYSSSGFS